MKTNIQKILTQYFHLTTTKRPQCGADAPAVLSAVYKSSTQAKKRQADVPQSGRSMIEMLGVLAIIGVLSVGGIMGYSKAMMRYKINKTIEQITYIAGNVRTTFANQGNYQGVGNIDIQKKAHIVPEDMWKDGQYYPQNVWGDSVSLHEAPKNSADTHHNKAFYISYYVSEEFCIELVTYDWRNAQVKSVNVADDAEYVYNFYVLPPVDVDTAIKMCEKANIYNNIVLNFYFGIDISDGWQEMLENCSMANGGC